MEPLVNISVMTILSDISTTLEERLTTSGVRTISRSSSTVTYQRELTIDRSVYDSIVKNCLDKQLEQIFKNFYQKNKDSCITLLSRVYATVQDQDLDSVGDIILEYVETYCQKKN